MTMSPGARLQQAVAIQTMFAHRAELELMPIHELVAALVKH